MLDAFDRHCVERIRNASTITIIVNKRGGNEFTYDTCSTTMNIKKLSHDIALAV